MGTHEERNLGAENDTGGSQNCKGSLVSPLGGLGSEETLGVWEKITQG